MSVPIDPSGKGLIHFAIELSNHDDLNFLLEFGPSLDERHPWPVFSAFEGDSVHERLEKLFRLCKPKTQAEWYDGLKELVTAARITFISFFFAEPKIELTT